MARVDSDRITAVRLEGLMHPSLSAGGAGRSSNSNVVLTEFEAEVASITEPDKWERIKLARAWADHEQTNGDFKIANAIVHCKPDTVFVNSGSTEDLDWIRHYSLDKGEERKLAKDGHTIAEIYSHKDNLASKTIHVRGQVTKFTANILNKNWLHIKDSSSHDDLTITTDSTVEVDDIIVISGKLELNKDFGYGYVYPLIIEDAKITTE